MVLKTYGNELELMIKLKADLVMSSRQLIKYVIRQVHSKYKRLIKVDKKTEFCFKVKDFKEYIYGNDSLMDYESARNALRGNQILNLVFQSKPKEKKKQNYIFHRD